MTVLAAGPRALPPHHDLLDAVATSIGTVVRAVLDDDRETARRVLRDGAHRHALVGAAEDRVRRAIVGSADRRTAAQQLLLVGDVARASRLVDDLARLVLLGRVEGGVSASRREALLLVARFGEERLHQLADGVGGPGLDREFVRCGRCLLDAAERLDTARATTRPLNPAIPCCAALATSVLQASRHALRAAS
ncbi:hypothetical protein [Nocardioides sp.]|uniref:hypothetical protein n=1 Tax=Nocardioides sp. TaxID=35761 RepID=UPI0027210D3D|nr:hypothetical protein [Nocardioides sp.]MDO9457336.1 hypothetical protein [Nocardioides sp.]